MQHLPMEFVQGKQGPLYHAADGFVGELKIEKVVITEQGTVNNLPIVDFVLVGPDGKRYIAVTTGGLVRMLGSAIDGVNERNHGTPFPQDKR